MVFGGLIPRDGRFFELFRESADQIVLGAQEFRSLLADMNTAGKNAPMNSVESRSRNIKAIEHKADEITHRTIEMLHKTFITPIDREDIHQLITRMDDILDYLEAASQRMYLYNIQSVTPEARDLSEICVASAEAVRRAVMALDNLENSKSILEACVEINRLENDADQALRTGMAKLFREEPDTRNLIKMKEIYELLETVTDRCEDVANIVEGIVLEYA
jgi:predicted phosphate transport protein (TIGR00153 family)